MNKTLKEIIERQQPKLPNLTKKEKGLYQFGLRLLSELVCEEFLDIPELPVNRFDTVGLFYSIPYFHDEMLYHIKKNRILLVVYKVEAKSSFCPLRIDMDITDKENFSLTVYDQSGEKTRKHLLFSREKGKYYTEIPEYETILLSELIELNNTVQ